ncbi:MAG: MFS transporter [Dehalococcoidia bacterium]
MKFEGLKEARSLLVIRDYRLLLISNPLMFAGIQIRNMAQSWLVLEETGSSIWVGIIGATPSVGIVSLVLIGGAIADRGNRRLLLYRSKIVLAALAFVTAFLVSSGMIEMWHMLLLGLGAGFSFAFMAPASQTMVMDVVGRDRLMPAITLNTALSTSFQILGPALGGVYLAVFGLNTIFYVLGTIYIFAAVANWMLKTNIVPSAESVRESGWAQIKEGLHYVWITPQVRWMMIFTTITIFIGAYPAVLPILVRQELGVPIENREITYGALLATAGAGSITSLLTLLAIGTVKNKGRVLMIAATMVTLAFVIMGLATNVYIAGIGTYFMGLAGGLFSASMGTLMQTSVVESMRGRVSSIFMLMIQGFAVGMILGGFLTAWIGASETMLLFSVFIGVILTTVFIKSPELRNAT